MVTPNEYVPQRGDAVWINFNPQTGHEQAGRRPAVVLSPGAYNGKTHLAILCPITNQVKGYPFEVAIPTGLNVTGCYSVRSGQEHGLEGEKCSADMSFARGDSGCGFTKSWNAPIKGI